MVRLVMGCFVSAWLGAAPAVAQDGDVRGLPVYVVQEGDTFAELALRATGDSLRYVELVRLNVALLGGVDELTPGIAVRLPPGWYLPDAAVPPGEVRAEPPPAGGPTLPSATQRAATLKPGSVSAYGIIDTYRPKGQEASELLIFFPVLSQLERDFEVLMRRASIAQDVDWGAGRIKEDRERESDLLDLQIDSAEVALAAARARLDECEKSAARARDLLRRYEEPSAEFKAKVADLKRQFEIVVVDELAVWEEVALDHLQPGAALAWDDYIDRLQVVAGNPNVASLVDLQAAHARLAPWRANQGDWRADLTPAQELAFLGEPVDVVLDDFITTVNQEDFRKQDIASDRMQEALAEIRKLPSCQREFSDAELFLASVRRKSIAIQVDVTSRSVGDLKADAASLADRFSGVLGEVQLIQSWLSNRIWTDLWWKSGVALRLAGRHDLGARRLAQAAAVATDHRLPVGEVPPSVEGWLREAEAEVLRRRPGFIRAHIPPVAVLTVDGREVPTRFGEAEVQLAPGVHRFVFWSEGHAPIMRLVGVVEAETRDFTWYETPQLTGDDEELLDERVYEPALPPLPKPKRWWFGVSAVGGATLGRAGFGADLTVRYFPKVVGMQFGGGVSVPLEPYWLTEGEDLRAILRAHGSLVAGGSAGIFQGLGGVGAYVDPLLGAGPMATLDLSLRAAPRIRVGLWGQVGYDVTPHFAGIDRLMVQGGVGVWL